jgi:hypothetical protein
MRFVRSLCLTLTLVLVPLAVPQLARAASYALVLGADGWINEGGIFDVTFSGRTYVTHSFSVGGRLGAAFITSPATLGIPIDLVLRGDINRFYIEGVAGPWIVFEGDAIRAHAGIGFGIHTRQVSVGLEVAYLDPHAMLGVRVAIPL